MLLGDFHKLLAENRDNKKITERTFIGLLVDVAHHSHNSMNIDFTHKISDDEAERLKGHYRTSMAYPYSVSVTRPPIPLLKERAILYQTEERFWDVCSFIINEIDDEQKLRDILSEVIKKDDLTFPKAEEYWGDNTYTYMDYISGITYTNLNLKLIYTVFIVEYYYFTITRNMLLSSVPDFDDIFPDAKKFRLRLLINASDFVNASDWDKYYSGEWNKTEIYIEKLNKISKPLCELPPPSLIASGVIEEFDINDYKVKIYKINNSNNINKIIIKKALKPGIYRMIQGNAQDGEFKFKDYVTDEKNDKLYAVTEDSILEIDLKNIGWENTGKILKTGKTPDYILHPIPKAIITEPYYPCQNSKKLIYYTYTEEIISNKKATITKTIIDPLTDETSKSTLIEFEEPIRIGEFNFCVSPDEKFILLYGSVVILIRLSDDSKEMEVLLESQFKKSDNARQEISYHAYDVKEISFNNNGHLTFSYKTIDNETDNFDKDLSNMR